MGKKEFRNVSQRRQGQSTNRPTSLPKSHLESGTVLGRMPPLVNPTIVLTGASRGLYLSVLPLCLSKPSNQPFFCDRGIEFVKQILAKYPQGNLVACVRDKVKGGEAVKAVVDGAKSGVKVDVGLRVGSSERRFLKLFSVFSRSFNSMRMTRGVSRTRQPRFPSFIRPVSTF